MQNLSRLSVLLLTASALVIASLQMAQVVAEEKVATQSETGAVTRVPEVIPPAVQTVDLAPRAEAVESAVSTTRRIPPVTQPTAKLPRQRPAVIRQLSAPLGSELTETHDAAAFGNPALRTSLDWPVFRGNSAGMGIAGSELPKQLEVLWKFEAEKTFFEATAAIVGGVVFVGDADKKFYAINLKTGKVLWTYEVEIGFIASAAVRSGRVYCGDSDGIFYCWDAKSGKLLWKHETGAEINAAANFYKDSVLVGSQDGSLYRFKADDGRKYWKYTIQAAGGIQCSPTLADGRCFVCGCDGNLHVIDVEKGDSVATLEIGDPTLATPAIRGDFVYFGNEGAKVFGVNWRKPKIAWTYQHPKRQLAFRSSAAVTEQAVFVGGRDKNVHAIDRANGNVLWTFPTRGRVDSSPVLVGNRVFVGSADGRLYAINAKSGKEIWNYDAGKGFTASPAVGEGRLVMGNDDGVLYCFGGKEK